MTASKKAQAVGALRKCAKEHEKDFTSTFNIRVSDLCSDVADYLEELEKENAELKAQIESDNLAFNESNEIIAELKGKLNERTHFYSTELRKANEQIEKMKNVGNCKHSMKCAKWNEKQLNLGLMKFCQNCKDWELAE